MRYTTLFYFILLSMLINVSATFAQPLVVIEIDAATIEPWTQSFKGHRYGCADSSTGARVIVKLRRRTVLRAFGSEKRVRREVRLVRQEMRNLALSLGSTTIEALEMRTKFKALLAQLRLGCTQILSETPTQTPTSSSTATPTSSPTSSPGASPSSPPSGTPTQSPTITPTATRTPTRTPTPSPTSSPTAPATVPPTPSTTPTATLTPMATPTPTQSPSPTPTASPSPTPTVTPTATPSQTQVIVYQQFTITLSTPRPYGFYVTGEPWVLGPATITGISPTPVYGSTLGNASCIQSAQSIEANCTEMPGTAICDPSVQRCRYTTTRNGAQVNPMPGTNAFDGRVDSAYNHAARATLPIVLPGNQISSVLLTASNPDAPTCSVCAWCGNAWLDTNGGCNWSPINRGMVFTVVPTVPFADSLRPPYVGPSNTKITYRTNNLNTAFLSLPPAPGAPSYASVLDRVARTWFVHMGAENYTHSSPSANMGSYGSGISRDYGVAALSLVRNDLTPTQRRTLALHLAQIGVDAGHALWNGAVWNGSGGHGGYGRTLSAIIAGHLLGNSALLNITSDSSIHNRAGHLCHTYYDQPSEQNYLGIPGFPRMDPYGHCPTPTALPEPTDENPNPPPNVDIHAAYFRCCTVSAWIAEVLAVRLLGLEPYVRHPALFDVMDRHMMEGIEPGAHSNEWANGMWHLYSGDPATRPLLCMNGSLNKCLVGCNTKTTPVLFSGEQGIDCGPGCAPPNNVCP